MIGGELVPITTKGIAHETVRIDIKDWFLDALPRHLRVEPEFVWRPDNETYCEPDIAIFPRRVRPVIKVPPSELLLLIEVADASMKKDTTTKFALYARLGVPEYWVVDAYSHSTIVYTKPTAGGYRSKRRVAGDRPLRPTHLPDLRLRLIELPFANE